MKITTKRIKKLNPCKDRYDNYLKYYGDKSLSPAQFMNLVNITQRDKLWVAFRLMPKENIKFAAADLAESVLHIFENQFPNDFRPRNSIEAARNINISAADARVASYAAAYSAACAGLNSVAYVSAYSAAYAADCAVAYVSAYSAAYAAACAAAYVSCAHVNQNKIILKYWK